MRKTNLPAILLLLVINSISCTNDSRSTKGSTYVKKEYLKDGVLKSEVTYRDSVKHGIVKEYFQNGKLRSTGIYDNDTLNGACIHYDLEGRIETKAIFWKGKPVGPIYYYKNGKIISYNERDYSGEVYYVIKYDTSNTIVKEEGVAISPNAFYNEATNLIKKDSTLSLYAFYSEPQGYMNTLRAFINDSSIEIKKSANHFTIVKYKPNHEGRLSVRLISTLTKEDKLIAQDSLLKVIMVEK